MDKILFLETPKKLEPCKKTCGKLTFSSYAKKVCIDCGKEEKFSELDEVVIQHQR